MRYWLIEFQARWLGDYSWETYTRLVTGDTFEDACKKLEKVRGEEWEKGSPVNFINKTIDVVI
jgi:hypothetical protein